MVTWFVAFPIEATEILSRVSAPPVHVSLLHPADLHMTLAYCGPVGEARARAAYESVGISSKLDAVLGSVVPMGHPRRFSALSATLSANQDPFLPRAEEHRDRALVAAGLPAEARPFLPHVTLARLARGATPSDRTRAVEWASALELSNVRIGIDAVALYASLPERGRRYSICDSRPLP